jgi:hypothetical protein
LILQWPMRPSAVVADTTFIVPARAQHFMMPEASNHKRRTRNSPAM